MTFKEWLKQQELTEVSTSTGDVAVYSRRLPIGHYADDDDDDEKDHHKKHKRRKHKHDMFDN